MKTLYKILFILLLTLSFTHSYAKAESANINEPVELGRIVVSNRIGQSRSLISSDITVIDEKEIENSSAKNIADLLKGNIGINVSSYTGIRKTVQVDLRGFGEASVSNVLLLVDGRRVNQVDLSGADWWQIPVESIKRIEIIRGSGSVLYGDNAVGGVINVVTEKGKDKPKGFLLTEGGSYNMKTFKTEISGSREKLFYYLFGRYHDTDGYRDNNFLESKDFNSRIVLDYSEELKFDLSGGYHYDSYGLPGALSESEIANLGRRATTSPDDKADTDDKFIRLKIDTEPEYNNIKFGNLITDFTLRYRDTYSSLIAFGVNSTSKHDIENISIGSKYVNTFNIFNRANKIIAGIDYYDSEDFIRSRGFSTDDILITKETLGTYLLDEAEILKNLFLTGGYRIQKAYYTFDQTAPSVKYTEQNPHETVGSIKFQYNYKKNSSVFIGYEESFRFPATDEWYSIFAATGLNEDLKPQSGKQYEIGLKHRINKNVGANCTFYLMDIENEIFFNPSTFANENYDETRHKGIEAGLNWQLTDRVRTFLNFTLQKSKFRGGDFSGNEIPAVPNEMINFGFDIRFLENFKLYLVSKYVGDRYMISDQKNQVAQLGDYFLVEGKLTFSKDLFEIFIGINNIFNDRYSEFGVTNSAGTAKNFYPSPERNYVVGVKYKF